MAGKLMISISGYLVLVLGSIILLVGLYVLSLGNNLIAKYWEGQ